MVTGPTSYKPPAPHSQKSNSSPSPFLRASPSLCGLCVKPCKGCGEGRGLRIRPRPPLHHPFDTLRASRLWSPALSGPLPLREGVGDGCSASEGMLCALAVEPPSPALPRGEGRLGRNAFQPRRPPPRLPFPLRPLRETLQGCGEGRGLRIRRACPSTTRSTSSGQAFGGPSRFQAPFPQGKGPVGANSSPNPRP